MSVSKIEPDRKKTGRKLGTPKTGGRQPGTPNKVTRDVKLIAQDHGPAVMVELIRLATKAENEAVRVSAAKEVIDRGYGKATQPLTAEVNATVKGSVSARIDWSKVPLELRRQIANLPVIPDGD